MFSGALKFKLDISHEPKRVYPQAFAEMTCVAHDCLIDGEGSALLIGYDKEDCLSLKYKANIHDNCFEILVTTKELFDELFPGLSV